LSQPTVIVIGGGVIGAACADELARRGQSVTLIDRGAIGHGCSYGNAGWVTPCFALPLPQPGMFLKSIGWLLDPASPLYIQPRPNWDLLCWLTRFLCSMNQGHLHRSTAALVELSKYSLAAYRELPGFTQKGLLMLAQTEAGLADAIAEMDLVAKFGIPGRRVDREQARQLEPALANSKFLGGVYFPEEAHVEPLATVNALIARAQQHGATILPNTELFEFTRQDDRIAAIETTHGPLRAEHFVLATGAWSGRVAKSLGRKLPMLSGKGYAVIVEPFTPKPAIPMMVIEKKLAITPRDDSVRFAGTLELVGLDESITARRVETIYRGGQDFFGLTKPPGIREVWRGLRPCTPDGVPFIGPMPEIANLTVAAGHQMLGLQTAPGTGRLVADLVTGTKPMFDPRPFRIDR